MFVKKALLLFALTALFTSAVDAQDARMQRLITDAEKAKLNFVAADKLMQHMFDKAYAYVILPNVGKGAAGIGGAAGSGIVYEQGKMIGSVKMKQLTVGWQVGGQAFREVIFFENKETLERFKTNEFEFAAQTSAAAIKAESYTDVEYNDGILVFTQKKTGLMYDASIGGQKFNYDSF
jgi:lipid-binding SYLF domain-containing protein